METTENVIERELERLSGIFFLQMSTCKPTRQNDEAPHSHDQDSIHSTSPAASNKWPILTSFVNHQDLLLPSNLPSATHHQTLSSDLKEDISETPQKDKILEASAFGESYQVKSEEIIPPSTNSSVSYPVKTELLDEGPWDPPTNKVNGKLELTAPERTDNSSTKSAAPRRVCTICNKSITRDNYSTHVRAMHSGETPFKCTYKSCTKQFADKHRLKKHQLTHSVFYEFSCKLCGSLAKRMTDLRKHIRRKHKAVLGECAADDGAQTEYLNTFINRCKPGDTGSPDFKECNNEISGQVEQVGSEQAQSLSQNNTEMENPSSKPPNTEYGLQLCDICGKTILHFNLKKHLARHREDRQYSSVHICPQCAHSFTDASSLKRHIQHTHEKRFSLQCSVCGQHARNKTELDRHRVRKHEGERNIACPMCPKLFVLKDDFTRHMKTVHDPPALSVCTICGQKYKQKRNLKVHLKRDHGLLNNTVNNFILM